MRTGRATGVAVAVVAAAALAAFWQMPSLVAAGQQAGGDVKQGEKPKVETQVVTVHKHAAGEPVVVTVEKQAGAQPRIVTHGFAGEPLLATALAGGGPRLGVRIRDVGKEDLAKLKLTAQNGVVIDEVMSESAAQKAGVKTGDVVVQFDGEAVRSAQQFTRLVRETVAGRPVKMGVIREGKRVDLDVTPAAAEETFSVTLGEDKLADLEVQLRGAQEGAAVPLPKRRLPGPEPGMPMPPGGALRWRREAPQPVPGGDALSWFSESGTGNFAFSMGRGRLGVMVQDLTPELATYFGVKDGMLVNSVRADSPAAKAGIKAGDVIGSVNGKAIASSEELVKELADKDGEVTVGVTRDKKPLALKATLETRKTPARRTLVTGRPA